MKKKYNISKCRLITQICFLSLFISGLIPFNYLMVTIIIISIILGPLFCGWACFLGLYQDICRYVGKFIRKDVFEPAEKVQKVLKYSRYLILSGSVAAGGIFLFPNKVWGNFLGILKGHLHLNSAFYFLILLGLFSLFTNRLFCRYLCPIGAKQGLCSLARLITINKTDSCLSCKLCTKECLMGISVDKVNSLASPDCINCFKCIETCPNNSLKIGIRNYLHP